MPFNDPPWHPMDKPVDIKHLGKLIEELGELQAATARCLIQGMYEVEPKTGKPNFEWIQEEIADVQANLDLCVQHFNLNYDYIVQRRENKKTLLRTWHEGA